MVNVILVLKEVAMDKVLDNHKHNIEVKQLYEINNQDMRISMD